MTNHDLERSSREELFVTLLVTIDIIPEHYLTASTAFKKLAEKTRAESGSIFYNLFKRITKPHRVIIHERWRDSHALEAHMNQPYLKEFLEISRPLLAKEISSIELRELE